MLIDSIIFGGELEVLLARLHELNDVVDKFVVVEAMERHGSSRPKPAVLAENWATIREFEYKLKYVVVPRLEPEHRGPNDSWPRENFHRNCIMGPVMEVAGIHLGPRLRDAILMVSDCDEIPRASAVWTACASSKFTAFSQDLFYYNVNSYMGNWNGTVAGRLGDVEAVGGPQALRNMRDAIPRISDGGWHFSYFGGRARILDKLGNFAHACEDSSKLALHWLQSGDTRPEDLLSGRDLYRRDGCDRKERRSHDDPRLPEWLRANMPRNFTEDGMREELCKT